MKKIDVVIVLGAVFMLCVTAFMCSDNFIPFIQECRLSGDFVATLSPDRPISTYSHRRFYGKP